MEENFLARYIEKVVKINLKSGFYYQGVVKEVADVGNGLIFISIIDKRNQWVTFSSNEIISINEVGGQ